MTKISSWMCDICKRKFTKDSLAYNNSKEFDILIPTDNTYISDFKLHFEDSCPTYRGKLMNVINTAIEQMLVLE